MSHVIVPLVIDPLSDFDPASEDSNAGRRKSRSYDWLKPAADWVLGLTIGALALPVVVGAWLLVRLTSRGPGFYLQARLGRNGRPFQIFKLRTMYHNCEAASGARWSVKGDPRITPVGWVLRRLHIDELPQVLNVLLGHMSLVGPRPERPEFVGPLAEAIVGYRGRLAVKPGITGLAQIQLPPDTDLDSVRAKLALDLCYTSRYSAWLDARILLGTVLYLAGVPYAGVRRCLSLPGAPPVGALPDGRSAPALAGAVPPNQPQALVGL